MSPDILREVEVPIVSDADCRAASNPAVTTTDPETGQCVTGPRSYRGQIPSHNMCAGSSGKDACQGDSGGPFTVKSSSTNQNDLVGVVSWGYGCAAVSTSKKLSRSFVFFQEGMFGVYVEVAKLRNWIDEKISEPSALPDDMPL